MAGYDRACQDERVRIVVLAAVALAGFVSLAAADAAIEPRAFQRAAQPGDRITMRAVAGKITDSRRIARYVDSRGRRVTLYLAKTDRGWLCMLLRRGISNGGGAGCSPVKQFFQPGQSWCLHVGPPLCGCDDERCCSGGADRVARYPPSRFRHTRRRLHLQLPRVQRLREPHRVRPELRPRQPTPR